MANVLDKIFERKRLRVAERMREIPLSKMLKLADSAEPRASFFDALNEGSKGASAAIIAELKKASPSLGLIRPDFKVRELAKSLSEAGASALSVLAEEDFFLGSIENLNIASKATAKPLLCKDFIFSEYQILEAKANGASAVLLIAAMLEKPRLRELLNFAEGLKLDVLFETHSEVELETAVEVGAKIIGVNSRNLKTLKIDTELFKSLISKIPSSAIAVAESGILTHADLVEAQKAGARAALVGTTLMSKSNPAEELKRLLGNL